MAVSDSIPNVRPCKKCGAADRFPSGRCRPCAQLQCKLYYENHKEQCNAMSAAWYANNKERHLLAGLAWTKANAEKSRAIKDKWAKANPEKIKAKGVEYYKNNREKMRLNAKLWEQNNRERANASDAAWRLKNKEQYKAAYTARRAKNPEKHREAGRVWRKRHPEKQNAWIKAHPEYSRIKNHNYQAKKRASGKLSRNIAKKLFALQQGKCPCCHRSLGNNYHLDHIIPVSLGGSNTDDNVQLLRAECNLSKSAKHPVDFMQSRGFLL